MLYRASLVLDAKSLQKIYFSFIHSYLNYANIAWGSVPKTRLKNLFIKQKHAVRTVFRANRFTHSKPLFRQMKVLNVYQINIMQILKFMHSIKLSTNPRVFSNQFQEVDHKYPTRSSWNNFYYGNTTLKSTSFSIIYRGPMLWNNFLTDTEKSILHLPLFLRKTK